MKNRILICLSILLNALGIVGQDFHYSQYDQAPMLLNPALTGFFDNDLRVSTQYRDQWSSFDASYKTFSVNFDGKYVIKKIHDDCAVIRDYFGFGLYMHNDKAGTGGLTSTHLMLSFSYNKQLFPSFRVSLGVAGGFGKSSINLDELHFLSQWNGVDYDSDLPLSLNNAKQIHYYPDFNAGITLSDSISGNLLISLGSSVSHLNQPRQDFLLGESTIPIKLNTHAEVCWGSNLFKYQASVLYSKQDNFNEWLTGFSVFYHSPWQTITLNPSKVSEYNKGITAIPFDLGIGLKVRLYPVRDIIPVIGAKMKNFSLNLSYDISVGQKYTTDPYQGGFEISASYTFRGFH